jgi:galactosylceramidase
MASPQGWMKANSSVAAAVGALGSHYPGSKGTSPAVRGAGVPAWSAEDYSTYSDATGAGCWGRLLVQNMGWDLSATISWYLIGSFSRGIDPITRMHTHIMTGCCNVHI